MKVPFTKMQGAGNDFVVLDETCGLLGLTAAHYQLLGDRHFGVGADQILSVRSSSLPEIDFEYVIHNADGQQVEQCGNGSRCFVRFVRERGLSTKDTLRVKTAKGVISPQLLADGRVTVDMDLPIFEPDAIPFDASGLSLQAMGAWGNWPLALDSSSPVATVLVATVSMGNPHAVLLVDDVDSFPVQAVAQAVQRHVRFPQGVNVGFMQVQDRSHVRLRVYERGVGETLACGTGACAAVVAGIRLGLLEPAVQVQARGGALEVAWAGMGQPVRMTGPARTVFEGVIELPD